MKNSIFAMVLTMMSANVMAQDTSSGVSEQTKTEIKKDVADLKEKKAEVKAAKKEARKAKHALHKDMQKAREEKAAVQSK